MLGCARNAGATYLGVQRRRKIVVEFDQTAGTAAKDSTIHMAPLWASMVAFRQLLVIKVGN